MVGRTASVLGAVKIFWNVRLQEEEHQLYEQLLFTDIFTKQKGCLYIAGFTVITTVTTSNETCYLLPQYICLNALFYQS